MFINPEADPDQTIDYVERIRRWRRVAPMHSINHTKCLGLAGQPVSTSFETKRTGNDMDNAVLQIGVWHSAQWNCLRHMLRTLWTPAEAEVALNELGVLPAIITQGHDWSFAATTLEEKRTVWIISP